MLKGDMLSPLTPCLQWMRVACQTVGHMSNGRSHVKRSVTCQTVGHMSNRWSHVKYRSHVNGKGLKGGVVAPLLSDYNFFLHRFCALGNEFANNRHLFIIQFKALTYYADANKVFFIYRIEI